MNRIVATVYHRRSEWNAMMKGLRASLSPSLCLGTTLARDSNGWLVALLPSEWALKTFADKNEDWIVSDQPFPPPVAQGEGDGRK